MNISFTQRVCQMHLDVLRITSPRTQQRGNRSRAEKPPPSRQSLHHGSMTPSNKSKKQRIWFLKMGLHLAQEDSNLKRLSTLCVLGEDHESSVPGSVLWKVSTALADLSLRSHCPAHHLPHWPSEWLPAKARPLPGSKEQRERREKWKGGKEQIGLSV